MDARKTRYGAADLDELFAGATKVIVAKGKKSAELDPRDADDRDELARAALGPTGNLRAPAARVGKTWLVGWGDPAWPERLG